MSPLVSPGSWRESDLQAEELNPFLLSRFIPSAARRHAHVRLILYICYDLGYKYNSRRFQKMLATVGLLIDDNTEWNVWIDKGHALICCLPIEPCGCVTSTWCSLYKRVMCFSLLGSSGLNQYCQRWRSSYRFTGAWTSEMRCMHEKCVSDPVPFRVLYESRS